MHSVQRLINEFIPTHYDVALTIDRQARQFEGAVTVTGTSVNGQIILHAKGLEITQATVDTQEASWQSGRDDEVMFARDGLTPGEHTLTVRYTGKITDQLHGLYPCRYEVEGQEHELLATQFESHYAREVFPCIDEPSAKATFGISITTEAGVTVLSNMPQQSHELVGDNRQEVTFETTPRMSTYLVALVIGDLQRHSGQTKSGVEVNIYATPAQTSASLHFALEHAIKTIEFFDEYFGVPYPLPKSDQVALPDFAYGAMENWGLITYRESALLYDPSVSSTSSKQYIATVISHELSHQWFGNLVTMAWWDDLWLNESFATVMEYVCVDALYPEWNMWLEFNTSESVMALRRDSLAGVQAVKVAVNHPDEIQSVFDGAIVYAKGARLMRMMFEFIGETALKKGLKAYFSAHAYYNTTGTDLWQALSTASGKDVAGLMEAWLTQSGFPIIHATTGGNLEQKQFFIGPHEPSDKRWPIPLGASQAAFPHLMEAEQLANHVDGPYELNIHDTAHFVTAYDTILYQAIMRRIRSGEVDVIQRAQFIKEQSLITRSDTVPAATIIDLLQAYVDETDEKVWSLMSGALGDLKRFVDPDTDAEAALKRFAHSLASPLFATLGWEPRAGESEDDAKLRVTIIATMLYGEDPAVIAEARQRYQTQPIEAMNPDLRELIMFSEVRFGDTAAAIRRLLELYRSTQSVDIQIDITNAVTGTRDQPQLAQLLALLKDTKTIRTQDTALWYVRLLSNRDSRDKTWQWLQHEWPWIQKTFSGDKSYDAFPRYTAQILASREQLEQYRDFFGPMQAEAGLARAITVGLSDIEARVTLIETDKRGVEKRLLEL